MRSFKTFVKSIFKFFQLFAQKLQKYLKMLASAQPHSCPQLTGFSIPTYHNALAIIIKCIRIQEAKVLLISNELTLGHSD
jgi:hypothetical protein